MREKSQVRTAQQVVLAELRDDILLRRIQPGTPIRADEIAERFGISRIPVREALKVLEGEGQIVHRAQHGYQLVRLSADRLIDIYDVRRLLEDDAARRAVPLVTAEHLQMMRSAEDAIDAANPSDLVTLSDANRQFHFSLFRAVERPTLLRHLELLWRATDAYRSLYFDPVRSGREARDEHLAIIDAVEQRDAERATELLAHHRASSLRGLLAVLGDIEANAATAEATDQPIGQRVEGEAKPRPSDSSR